MIVSKTTVNNTASNANNNGVTFTDKPKHQYQLHRQPPSAVQSSSSSSRSMPNTGMNNEVTAELGMVGVRLVLGLVAKRKNKNR